MELSQLKQMQQIAKLNKKLQQGKLELDPDLPLHPFDRYVGSLGLDGMKNMVFGINDKGQQTSHGITEEEALEKTKLRALGEHADQQISEAQNLFWLCGKNTFKLPPRLSEMFAHTDLDNIIVERLPPAPYMSIYIDTPESPIEFTHDLDGEPVQMNGMYYVDAVVDGVRHIRNILWAAERPEAKYLGQDAHLAGGLQLDPRHDPTNLEDLMGVFEAHNSVRADELFGHDPERIERDTDALVSSLRLAFNLLLYLNADPELAEDIYAEEVARLKKKVKRGTKPRRLTNSAKRAKKKLRTLSMTKVNLVAPSMMKAARDGAEKTAGDGDGPGRARHWVRGHWRNQPYGPRDNPEYKTIWIQPHLRGGDEDGAVVGRVYDVE